MPNIPLTTPFTPQEYSPLYVSVDDNHLTEVQSITVDRVDGGARVETIMRGFAGRVLGAAMATCTLRGVIPYQPTDVTGAGFANQGMVTGSGVQLDATMLTQLNQNGNAPVKFIIAIGNPAVQQLVFKGFITNLNIDYAVGKQADFTLTVEGSFNLMN